MLKYIFQLPDLRKRILFTLLIIAVSRIGTFISVPGIDASSLKALIAASASGNSLLGFVDLFSGGALTNFSILSMGIIPYINASIILQLLTVITPSLKELAEEGESGRRQIAQYTRYLTIVLAFIQSVTISVSFLNSNYITINTNYFNFFTFILVTSISMVAGTSFLMWLAELMTVNGIGNGASLNFYGYYFADAALYLWDAESYYWTKFLSRYWRFNSNYDFSYSRDYYNTRGAAQNSRPVRQKNYRK